MIYEVLFKPSAEREFNKLPENIQLRIARELALLVQNPRPSGCKKLKSRPGYRIRVGDCRVIYAIDDPPKIVRILAIGDRRDIYR